MPIQKSLSEAETRTCAGLTETLVNALETVIKGKRPFLMRVAASLAADGHILIEDLPGLGKTTVAKALSRAIASKKKGHTAFRRIQFTPDLLPYDITGVDVFDPEKGIFVFQPGPVFANIVLADEINRTTPKVQSALLEAMAERQVTVGNMTHELDGFFFIIATQNPIESEGTYPLPHAQLDRFLMKISLGYPDRGAELSIIQEEPSDNALPMLKPVISFSDVITLKDSVRRVYLDEKLENVIVDLSIRIRNRPEILLGPSPRASLALARAARSWALASGRNFVVEQDILDLACDVLAHRLILKDMRHDARALSLEEAHAACESKR